MPTDIIDTHCHLDMEEFNNDIDDVVERSAKSGIRAIVMASTQAEDFNRQKMLSDKYEMLYYLVGIHPHEAKTADIHVYNNAISHLKNIKCKGIGEIGLDYYYSYSEHNIQKEVFNNFLDIAVQHKKPVSIHSREATDDLVNILKTKKDLTGVIHCFSGDEKLLKIGLDKGLYFGIGGVLTFKNSKLANIINQVPLESIVFETDAPYLAPVPFRGKRNEPSYIPYVIEKFSEITHKDKELIARHAFENSKAVFSL